MTEPTREQIIIALKRCQGESLECELCPLNCTSGCIDTLMAESAKLLTSDSTRIAQLEAENKRLKEERRWVSTKEKLPESGKHVLLCCEVKPLGKKYICDGYYASPKSITCVCGDEIDCEYDDKTDEYYLLEGFYEVIKNWEEFSSISISDFVTHWMPLPQPPEKESEGVKWEYIQK